MTTWRGNKEGFKEGATSRTKCAPYNIFCDDYFQEVGFLNGIPRQDILSKYISDFTSYISNPIQKLDDLFLKSIYNMLETYAMTSLEDCTKEESIKNVSVKTFEDTNSFTWFEQFTTMTEGLQNYFSKDKLTNTLEQLKKNHPNIPEHQLTTFYMNELNKLYTKYNGNVSQNDLFEFNNDIDMNKLTDPNIIKKLEAIPTPSPPFKSIDYATFSATKERFKLNSTDPIMYYPPNYLYFPIPNMPVPSNVSLPTSFAYFQNLLEQDFMNGKKEATTEFNKEKGHTIPSKPPASDNDNKKYAFSMNLASIKTGTISDYLKNILLYFSFIIVNQSRDSSFTDILPKIADFYIKSINAIDFFKYSNTNKYLNETEIAVFNHLLFCCLNQTGFNTGRLQNVYDVYTEDSKMNKYINIGTKKIQKPELFIRDISTLIIQRSNFVSNTSTNWYSNSILISGFNDSITITGGSNAQLLREYISKITPSVATISYFTDDYETYLRIQACEAQNNAIKKQFLGYAYTIKQEFYRILIIPIVIYLVYNFYYMFLFKDCFGYAKDTSNDEPIYEKTCDKGCFFPQFPDWELNFHNMEKHRTDYVLEFIFKPAKCFYVFLNAMKTFFRNLTPVNFLINEYPYILFLGAFAGVYGIVTTYGGKLLNMMYGLMKFDIPDASFGNFKLSYMAGAIVWISFFKSFIKIYSEDPVKMGMNIIASNLGAASEAPQFPSLGWIMNSMSAIVVVFKSIIVLLYWLLRAAITVAIIPISMFITVVYFFWVSICSMFDYTDNDHSYNDKIELMDRVIYTKLFLKSDNSAIWSLRTVCFLAVFLLTEIVIFYTLSTNLQKFNAMPAPTIGGPGAATAFESVKIFMKILTYMLIVLLVIWSIFKYYSKKKMLNEMYTPETGDHILDNSNCEDGLFPPVHPTNTLPDGNSDSVYENFWNDNKDDIDYFIKNKDDAFTILWNSDRLNDIFSKYYAAKTHHKVSRPLTQKLLNKLSGIGKYINDTINPPKGYHTETPDNTNSMFGANGLFNNITETFNQKMKEEKETFSNTKLDSKFLFGNSDPNKLVEGVKNLFVMNK